MKKVSTILILTLVTVSVFLLGFNYKHGDEPNEYYRVYLDDEVIGNVKSKKELEKYIDKRGEFYKNKYGVDKVYAPLGVEIKKINSYSGKIDSVKDVYDKISKKRSLAVDGYSMSIKTDKNPINVFITKEEIFKKSVESVIETFIGKERYELYKSNKQTPVSTTGSVIENIYIENDITIKQTKVSVDEDIYKEDSQLSKYLLFGTTKDQNKYTVKLGDTISSVAFNNQISIEEFLISNPEFTNVNNLLFPGQEVVIGILDPKVKVVVAEYIVKDDATQYKQVEQVDQNKTVGFSEVIQKGENGLMRISQRVKTINGVINFIDPVRSDELKPAVDEITVLGGKPAPSVGGKKWYWPTNSGYTISSDYAYRINPFSGRRELHGALDISGTGRGSNVYAANNGVIVTAEYHYSYGNYIVINHNNGYYTLYAHMDKLYVKTVGQTVAAGTVIGSIGMTGDATGPHLHFEVWYGGEPWRGTRLNPWTLFR